MNTKSDRKDSKENGSPEHGRKWVRLIAVLTVLAVGALGGVWTGNWWTNSRPDRSRLCQRDEYVGLGPRTGLTGNVTLSVQPINISVKAGEPVNVSLTLANRGRKPVLLNSWFTPMPAVFKSNQLPIKVRVTRNGEPVAYRGNAVLFPLHTKRDFIKLRPGEERDIRVDISRGPDGGRWDVSIPGQYKFEIWYETYLTGRYIGVKAWTGMTNHVIVNALVLGQ